MFKKITAVLSAISIAAALIPTMAFAEKSAANEIIRYECEAVTGRDSNNDVKIYNKIDENKYPLLIATAGYNQSHKANIINVNDITYPEKTYVESWSSAASWYQNIMRTIADDELKAAFEGGVAADIWFKPIDEGSGYGRYVLLEARVAPGDPLFRIMYHSNGDGAGNGRIIVARKVEKDGVQSYAEYHFGKTLQLGAWHNVCVSLDESDGVNVPAVIVDGENLSVYDPENNNPTKDKGYTLAGYDNLSQVRIGAGTEIGHSTWHYNSHILLSDFSIYDGARTEADMLEDYQKNVGYYEPEYDIKVYDGFGALATKSGLEDIFAGSGLMPVITIDTTKVENTDAALFNSQNVTITDITGNKQLNITGTLSDDLYTVTSDEFTAGHRYLLTIDEAVSTSRSVSQTIEFAATKSVPEIVAQYNMNKTVNSDNRPSIEDAVSGQKYSFDGEFLTTNKYDDAYYVYAGWAITEPMSENLKAALADEFTIDIWFKTNPKSGSNEERIWSVARPASGDDKGNIHMMLNKKGSSLGFKVNYEYTEDAAKKEWSYQYLTNNTTNYYSSSGWNHLIFSYDTKTEAKSAVLNGHKLVFSPKVYAGEAPYMDAKYERILPEGAKPYTMHENARMLVNGTVNIDNGQYVTWGGWISRYFIGKQTYYNKAATDSFMNYLAGLDNDKYDTAYDLTLLQDGNELAKNDLVALAKGNLTAQIAIARTDGFNGNVYIENAQNEKTAPEISWNEEGTLATLTFAGLTNGEYRLVIAKEATDSAGAAIRKTDYVLPMTVVGTTELSLLVNGAAVPEGTKVTGTAYALAELVNVDNAVLIAARYKGGKLVDILTSDEKFGELNNQLGIYIEGITKGETVKLMLWNSLGEMNPVIAGAEY